MKPIPMDRTEGSTARQDCGQITIPDDLCTNHRSSSIQYGAPLYQFDDRFHEESVLIAGQLQTGNEALLKGVRVRRAVRAIRRWCRIPCTLDRFLHAALRGDYPTIPAQKPAIGRNANCAARVPQPQPNHSNQQDRPLCSSSSTEDTKIEDSIELYISPEMQAALKELNKEGAK